ncbi:MAG TPA: NAD-dependent epimerase/dehydratase family protein, partial [Chthoniobacterales bacterium]
MKVLVTGGAGFIGSHLVEALLARSHEVAIIDDFNDFYNPATKQQNVAGVRNRAHVYSRDICDEAGVRAVFADFAPETVIHLAARAGVRPSVVHPEWYLKTNIFGTYNLLAAARDQGTVRFIFASSSSVYGASREVPFREDQALVQTFSPYASTKLAGEHLCSNYAHLYGLKVACLRFFTVYGPRQRPDLSIHKFTRLIAQGKPIEVYGDGSARRDFTYVEDIVQGVIAALDYDATGFEVFNLGENATIDLLSVIRLIEEAFEKKAEIQFLPPMPGDMPQTYADISKARALL